MYYIKNREILLIDPKEFGLSPRTLLGKYLNNVVLIKDRKSRIIMKDGKQIFKQIQLIKKYTPNSNVNFATSAPACGKTIAVLKAKGIKILSLKKRI